MIQYFFDLLTKPYMQWSVVDRLAIVALIILAGLLYIGIGMTYSQIKNRR